MDTNKTWMHGMTMKAKHLYSLVAVFLLMNVVTPLAWAGAAAGGGGGGGGAGGGAGMADAIQPITDLIDQLSAALTGPLGIAIATLCFVGCGLYIMWARSTGKAVSTVSRVLVGVVIIFGGGTMITNIQQGVAGALM